MLSPARRTAVSAAVLVLAAAVVHLPTLSGGVPYWRDAHLGNVPGHLVISAILKGGSLPEWFPWDGAGSPLLATPPAEILHPTILLYLLLPPFLALALHGFLGTLAAMLGTWRLARELGRSEAASLLAAVLYGAGGYLACLTEQTFMLVAAGTLPWCVLAVLVARRRGGRALLWPPIAFGLQLLAGDPQAAILVSFAAAALVWAQAGLNRRTIAVLASGPVGGALLAAMQILPALELAGQTERAGVIAGGERWPFDLVRAAGMVFPLHHGITEWVDSTYLGLGALALAAAALATIRGDRAVRALVGLTVLGTWLALGEKGWLNVLAGHVLPMWSRLRFPIKSIELAVFALALLAAFGADALASENRGRALRFAGLGAGLSLIVFALAAEPVPLLAALTTVAAAVAGVVGTFLGGTARRAGLAALAASVVATTYAPIPVTDPAYYEAVPPLAAAARERGVGLSGPAVDRLTPFGVHLEELADIDRAAGGVGSLLGSTWQLPSVSTYSLSASRRLRLAFLRGDTSYEVARRLLGVFGVGYLVIPQGLAEMAHDEVLAKDAPFRLVLVRTPRSLPRAYAVHRAVGVADPAEAANRLFDGPFKPGREVLLEGDVPAEVAARPDEKAVPATIAERGPASVDVDAELPWDGFVVLNEAWFPGWRAFVDGREVPLRIGNLAMRAVEVPAGKHRIAFRYRTPGLDAGFAVSAAALLALLVAAFLLRRPEPA